MKNVTKNSQILFYQFFKYYSKKKIQACLEPQNWYSLCYLTGTKTDAKVPIVYTVYTGL